jgi:Zn-dependent protease with chaperone function
MTPTLLVIAALAAVSFVAPATAQTRPASPAAPQLVIAPGKTAAVGSVASDNACERMFEPTSPMAMLGTLADDYLGNLLAPLTGQPAQKPRVAAPAEKELRAKFKQMSRTSTWLPIEAEEWMGEAMMDKVVLVPEADEREGRRAADYARVRDLFQRLVAALPSDQAYNFRLRFSADPSTNLTTVPGGTIVVNAGVLPHPDALVTALLAHEIAHVTKRHYTRQIQGYLADTVTVAEVVKAVSAGQAQKLRWKSWAAGIGTLDKLFSNFYSDQELEADACIPRLVKAANLPYEPPAHAFRAWALADAATAANPPQNRPAAKAAPGASRLPGDAGTDRRPFEMRHPRSDERVTVLAASLQYWRARDASMSTAGAAAVRLGGSKPTAGAGDSAAPPAAAETSAEATRPPAGAQGLADGAPKESSNLFGDLAKRVKRGAQRLAEEVGKPNPNKNDDPPVGN